ncbi:unnamed protein product [Durusdinium trenchii]|uniref:RING-type domain-containing protein n=1 Tax=Durusdinium trenchii TaxID=1381693 RepID=A0ABP0LE12_9DINO
MDVVIWLTAAVLAVCLSMAVGTAVCTFRDSLRLLEERKPCGVKWEPNVEDGQAFDHSVPVVPAAGPETCTICLEEIEEGQPCRELECKHAFHADCLHAWWERCARSKSSCSSKIQQVSCPSCRQVQVFGRSSKQTEPKLEMVCQHV